MIRALTLSLTLAGLMLGVGASAASASFYDVIFCAAGNGSGDPTLGARPGFFDFGTNCGEPPSYPSDGNHYLRLNENETGAAGQNDEASMSWYAPEWTSIVAGGGYTREPNAFNDGWRARFWGEDFAGGVHNIMLQGSGIEGTGPEPFITKNTTSIFAAHLWPYGGWDDYKRFVFGLWCVRPAGCDRSNFNAVDANSITLVANDKHDPSASFVDGPTVRGEWVRGYQVLAWYESDLGSGLRFSRLGTDGSVFGDGTINYESNGGCRIGHRDGNREFAKSLQPCTLGPYLRYYGFETGSVSDGVHQLAICLQDYSQYVNGADTCDRRTVRTDNTAPGAPPGLKVTSGNPQRYSSDVGVSFSLPPNAGSPITKVHYSVINAAGAVVQPEQVVSATNPTGLKSVSLPKAPGDYRLRLWLEDQVGWVGGASVAPIPHDTVPPAAPQDVVVAAPESTRAADGFDVHWRNIVDSGSLIDEVHYEVLNASGGIVVPKQDIHGANLESISNLDAPDGRGNFSLKVWLSDSEGNVGAAARVPLGYRCVRSSVSGGSALSAVVDGSAVRVVRQGEGATLEGVLRGPTGPVADAPVCVFSNVVTDQGGEFLGLAITGKDGAYRFGISPGPSRDLTAVYRPDHREVRAESRLETIVHPTFYAKKKRVRNKQFGRFYGEIPGPHNDRVVVVLQARRGKGWIAFRRYRTRGGGKFSLVYRFHNTTRPTKYVMRAQVRQTTGYPYLQGNSDRLVLRVLPSRRAVRRSSGG